MLQRCATVWNRSTFYLQVASVGVAFQMQSSMEEEGGKKEKARKKKKTTWSLFMQ